MRRSGVGYLAIGNSLNCDLCELFPPYTVLLIFTYLLFFYDFFIID